MKKKSILSYAFIDDNKIRKRFSRVCNQILISLFLPFFLMRCQIDEERVYEKQDFTVKVNGIDFILFERIDAILHEKDLPTQVLRMKVKAKSTTKIILMKKQKVVSDKIYAKNDEDKEIPLKATRITAFTIEEEQTSGNTIILPNNLEFQISKKQDIENIYGNLNEKKIYGNMEILKYKVMDAYGKFIFVMVFQFHHDKLSGIGYASVKGNIKKLDGELHIQ